MKNSNLVSRKTGEQIGVKTVTRAVFDENGQPLSDLLTNQNEAINTNKSNINVLSSRMDTFTSLEEGSTTGDAELQDIRVGYDGTTYDTAGNAVRGQISDVRDDLENYTYSDIEKEAISYNHKRFLNPKWNMGACYYNSGTPNPSLSEGVGRIYTDIFTPNEKSHIICNADIPNIYYVVWEYETISSQTGNRVANYTLKDAKLNIIPIFTLSAGKYYRIMLGTLNNVEVSDMNEFSRNIKICEGIYNTVDTTITASDSVTEQIYGSEIISYKTTSKTFAPIMLNIYNQITFEITNSSETWIYVAKNEEKYVMVGICDTPNIRLTVVNGDGSFNVIKAHSFGSLSIGDKFNFNMENNTLTIIQNDEVLWLIDLLCTGLSSLSFEFGVCDYSTDKKSLLKLLPSPNTNISRGFYDGKKLNLLGDSFTDNSQRSIDFDTAPHYIMWHDWMEKILGCKESNVYGYGGTTIADNGSGISFVDRVTSMDNTADGVIIFGGTNDYGNNIPLGTIDTLKTDTSKFYGALKYLCEYLYGQYPGKPILFVTPSPRISPADGMEESTPCNKQVNLNNNTLEDFVKAIIEVCESYNIPYYDLYHNCGMYPHNRQFPTFIKLYKDGLHWSEEGHEISGRQIAKALLQLR